LKVGN